MTRDTEETVAQGERDEDDPFDDEEVDESLELCESRGEAKRV